MRPFERRGSASSWAVSFILAFLHVMVPSTMAAAVGGVPSIATSEGFFMNRSSYATVSDDLSLAPGSFMGFSFRTCAPGELLRQTGDSNDELKMQLDAQGRLILSVMTDEGRSEAVVEARLLDARWHTVLVTVDEDTNNLTVNVSNGGGLAVLSGSILRSLRLASSSPQFRIGAGMTACFREGPGVRFTKSDVIVNSDAVKWLSSDESCFLPDSCEGKFLFEKHLNILHSWNRIVFVRDQLFAKKRFHCHKCHMDVWQTTKAQLELLAGE